MNTLTAIFTPKSLKSYGLAPVVLSGFVSLVIACAVGFSHDQGWSTPGVLDIAIGLPIWLLVYTLFVLLLSLFERKRDKTTTQTDVAVTPNPPTLPSFNARKIFVRFLVIISCWLPILLVVYPGILFNDTIIQLAQWFGEPMYGYSSITNTADYSDHHPIFLMLMYGLIVQAGWTLFGDPNIGLFCLVITESLVTAASYSFALNYLERIGASRLLIRTLFSVWCVFPLYGWFCAIPVKETAFAWLYILFCICIFELGRTRYNATGAAFYTLRWRLPFIFICLLLALCKKTGVYLVIITCLVLIVLYRRELVTLLLAALLPALAIFAILPQLIFPAFNISPGTPVEMLGIFYQQTARAVLDYPDDVSEEEYKIIDELFGYQTIEERYNPRNIDPLKGFGFLQGVEAWPTTEQINRYREVYLAQGIRHPDAYFRALGSLWSPWFYPQSYAQAGVFYLSENWIEHAGWPPDTVPHYNRPEALAPITLLFIQAELYLAWLPFMVPFYVPAFYLLLLPAFCWTVLLRSRRNALAKEAESCKKKPGYCAVMVPVIVSLALLLLSPKTGIDVESMRYAIPFISSAPLLVGLAITSLVRPSHES